MSNNQFHIVLPSNASGDVYPDNTIASYKTHLSQPIQLNGSWMISLLEVIYPITWTTIESKEYFQLIVAKDHVVRSKQNDTVPVCEPIFLTEGRYETAAELAQHMISLWEATMAKLLKPPVTNTAIQNDMMHIEFNPRTNRIKFVLKDKRYAIKFSIVVWQIFSVSLKTNSIRIGE